MRTRLLIFRLAAGTALLSLMLSACVIPTPVPTGGIVRGVVYSDLNGDGTIEAGEGPLQGATVTLNDCGPAASQTTGADGAFNFTNLPEGTCHVSVSKAGWVYSGSFPSLSYPVPVASDPALPTSFSLMMAPVAGITPTQVVSATPVSSASPALSSTPTAVPSSTPTDTPTLVPSDTPGGPTFTPTAGSSPMVTPLNSPVNCRFGPSTAYLTIGYLNIGTKVPILGTNPDHSWWQIQKPGGSAGINCWVSNIVVQTSGDLTLVPVVPIPGGLVVTVAVDSFPATIYGFCHGPNAFDPQGSITTNGPASVVYHWEIWYNGSLYHSTADTTLTFASASTQTVNPGSDHGDCGDYVVKLIVTSPNSISAQQSFTIAAYIVTNVTVQPIATIHGTCQQPNPFDPQGSITTNGPASVVYHWEIWYNGSLFHHTSDTTLVFGSASTQSLNPGSDHGDCGSYVIKLIVTSPNSISAQQSFSVVHP